MDTPTLVFAYMIPPGSSANGILLLAESLRSFGGKLASCEVWAFLPQLEQTFPERIWERLNELNVKTIPFQLPPYALGFPFAAKVYAAGLAEEKAERHADLLCWMDHDTLFIQDPNELALPLGKKLGCCPVHHTLIGSHFDQPLDAFWSLVYEHCQVSSTKVFPMTSIVDAQVLRPYYNAGLLVVRPESLLLRSWLGAFARLYQNPAYETLYQANNLYKIFIHQAILAGTILRYIEQEEIYEFSGRYNYPLHLHPDFPTDRRAKTINQLVTCRFESLFDQPGWETKLPIQEPLKSWLALHVR